MARRGDDDLSGLSHSKNLESDLSSNWFFNVQASSYIRSYAFEGCDKTISKLVNESWHRFGAC